MTRIHERCGDPLRPQVEAGACAVIDRQEDASNDWCVLTVPRQTVLVTTDDESNAAIARHLYEHPPVAGMKYQSSLIAILRDARGAGNRDDMGRVKPGCRSQSWLAATAYLILLDQVGKSFGVAGIADEFNHAIGRALSHFSPVGDKPTVEALYALRCTFAHDYSLFNEDPSGRHPLRNHAFNLTADTVSPLVEFPAARWDGTYHHTPPEQTTTVNLWRLGDLGETVVGQLRKHHRKGTLELRLALDEFQWRYGMSFRVP